MEPKETGIQNQDPSGGGTPPASGVIPGEPPAPQGDPPVEPKDGIQKRIGELTKEKRDAERDAAYWRGVAEGATRTVPVAPGDPPKTEGPPELDPNDFNSDADYLKAVAKQVRDQALADIKAEKDKERKTETQTAVTKVIKAARDKYPDFDAVALNTRVPISQHMYDAAMGENLGEILYELGKNPTEAARIAGLSPVQQAKEIGRIETILATKPVTKVSGAPPPPPTVGSGGSPPVKPDAQKSRAELHEEWERLRRLKK